LPVPKVKVVGNEEAAEPKEKEGASEEEDDEEVGKRDDCTAQRGHE
jgi:hypothetical protein